MLCAHVHENWEEDKATYIFHLPSSLYGGDLGDRV